MDVSNHVYSFLVQLRMLQQCYSQLKPRFQAAFTRTPRSQDRDDNQPSTEPPVVLLNPPASKLIPPLRVWPKFARNPSPTMSDQNIWWSMICSFSNPGVEPFQQQPHPDACSHHTASGSFLMSFVPQDSTGPSRCKVGWPSAPVAEN